MTDSTDALGRDTAFGDLDRAATQAASAGRWNEAERLWQAMCWRDPNNRNALWGLGFIALQRGDATEARVLLSTAHKAEPRDKVVLLTLATACKESLDDEAEAAALNALLALDPDYLPGLLAQGALLARQGHADAAMVYRQALEAAQREPDGAKAFAVQLTMARAAVEAHENNAIAAAAGSMSGYNPSTAPHGQAAKAPDEASAPQQSYQSASNEDRRFWISRTVQLMRGQLSDVRRWANLDNHQAGWYSRGAALAQLVRAGESVFEFGAGHSALPTSLPYECAYQASDLAPLNEGVAPFDLNAPSLRAISGYQVAAFSGVLEYVHDLPRAAGFLADNFETVVCSYAVLHSASAEEYAERRYAGWFTDLSAAAFVDVFERAGFGERVRRYWNGQFLFRFEKR